MLKQLVTTIAITLMPVMIVAATPSLALTYFLEQDLGVEGFQHYCRYSNDRTYSVNATQLCPLSLQDTGPGIGEGTGFKQGEYRDGLTKVCVYSVLGHQKAIRIDGTDLCPLTYDF
jgi:hypothetical protein